MITIRIHVSSWGDIFNFSPSSDFTVSILNVFVFTCLHRTQVLLKDNARSWKIFQTPDDDFLAVGACTFHFLVQMLEANNYLLFRLNPMTHILPDSTQTLFVSPPISSHLKEEMSLYSATQQEEAYIPSLRSYCL